MKEPVKREPGKEAPDPKPSQLDEVRRMTEQHAHDLREMMAKLRKHFHRGCCWVRLLLGSSRKRRARENPYVRRRNVKDGLLRLSNSQRRTRVRGVWKDHGQIEQAQTRWRQAALPF